MMEKQASGADLGQALVLTDGKAGDRAQCIGLVERLEMRATEIVISPSLVNRTVGVKGHDSSFDSALISVRSPPSLVVASGRRTVPYLRYLQELWGASTLTVFLKDPRTGLKTADLIWVPAHDRLRGGNVIVTPTGPHRFSTTVRAEAPKKLQARLGKKTERPWLAVLLGGPSGRVRYDRSTCDALEAALRKAVSSGATPIVTASRRTPAALLDAIKAAHPQGWVWDGKDENPLAGMLGACDGFFVTGDSHNMVSEALCAGRQTMVFRPKGLPKKFVQFLDRLECRGAICAPVPLDPEHRQEPIDATPMIAARIREALGELC